MAIRYHMFVEMFKKTKEPNMYAPLDPYADSVLTHVLALCWPCVGPVLALCWPCLDPVLTLC